MNESFLGIVAVIIVIGVVCSLFDVPEKFQKLLYIICAILVIALVFALFGIGFGGHVSLR